jgi:hypothetical protein
MYFRKEAKNRTVNIETEAIGDIFEEMEEELYVEEKEKLATILTTLNDERLSLIEMRFFEKRSFKDIADIMGITENNAKVKVYRTLDKIKKHFNIDRDSISSEEVSTFKDFKSILRKHSQTSEDLAKIKPVKNNSILYWSIGIIGILATSTLIVLNSSYESSVEDDFVVNDFVETKKRLEDKSSKAKPVLIENSIEWSTIIKTPKQPISELVNAQTFSASRIEYVEFDSFKDIKTLLPGIQKSDADFVLNTIVFKIEHKEEITVSNKNELYKFGEESKWLKVDFKPVLMPFIE